MKAKIIYVTSQSCLFVLIIHAVLIAESGGGFDITEAVVAGGGGSASAGNVALDATAGQSVAGGQTGAGIFSVTSGFWNYTSLAPTAASVSISGRVLSPTGAGVSNAVLYLQTQEGEFLLSRSSSFGYYRFDNIIAGQMVLISVQSKRFTYAPRTIMAADDVTGLDFIPEQE